MHNIVIIDKNFKYKNEIIKKLNNEFTKFIILNSDDIIKINEIIINILKQKENPLNLMNIIRQELYYLGYSSIHCGTEYVAEAIYLAFNNKEECINLRKSVYPILANRHNKSIQSIKCNMINATNMMTYNCDEKKLIQYLNYYNYVKPGPKRIIESVVNKLNEKYSK